MFSEEQKPTLLLVDDNPKNLQILSEIMESFGYDIALAMSGKQVFEYLSVEKPDLILLDIMMPEMDGFEVCTLLKNNIQTKDIPVVFVTAKSEIEDMVKGFEVGGVDYITKPFNFVELKIRVKTHLELKKSMDRLAQYNSKLIEANEQINLKNIQLSEMMEKMEQLSITDALTGIHNRRFINDKLLEELARHKRSGRPFSVIIGDIDFFKRVNDTYGHSCGDYALKIIADILKSSVREQDSTARWGGEEFFLLLPETGYQGAEKLAETIRQKVEAYRFRYENNEFHVTMTFGVCEFNDSMSLDEMIKRADDSLYEGKRRGRNCVV